MGGEGRGGQGRAGQGREGRGGEGRKEEVEKGRGGKGSEKGKQSNTTCCYMPSLVPRPKRRRGLVSAIHTCI